MTLSCFEDPLVFEHQASPEDSDSAGYTRRRQARAISDEFQNTAYDFSFSRKDMRYCPPGRTALTLSANPTVTFIDLGTILLHVGRQTINLLTFVVVYRFRDLVLACLGMLVAGFVELLACMFVGEGAHATLWPSIGGGGPTPKLCLKHRRSDTPRHRGTVLGI